MSKKILSIVIFSFILGGCASIPMESVKASNEAKQFNPPPEGKSGLYIYRNSFGGKALKKDIWLDGKCVGQSAPDTFFYKTIDGNKVHKISTESEFSPNDLTIKTDSGKNYFVRQYIKVGFFVGGAGLEIMSSKEGMESVMELDLAKSGTCSQ